jgi:hypothetical protein
MTGGSNLFSLKALAPPEEIRRKAQEIISRPDYELKSPQNSHPGILTRILIWFLEKLQAFFEAMSGLPDVLRWIIVVVLFVALMVLILHILVTFLRAFRGLPRRRAASLLQREPFVTPEDLEHAAELSHAEGDYIQAVRHLFLAALVRIERAEDRPIRKGITNRELLHRYRSTPLFGSLARFVDVIDAKWYGHDICQEEDYRGCRTEYSRIRGIAERRRHAVSA